MSILIVGGDRLGQIPKCLRQKGFQDIEHITGRKVRDGHLVISPRHETVLVLTDYVNHGLARLVKVQAKRNEQRVVFAKRSWAEIRNVLESLN